MNSSARKNKRNVRGWNMRNWNMRNVNQRQLITMKLRVIKIITLGITMVKNSSGGCKNM